MPNLKELLQQFRDWLRTPPQDLTGKERTLRWWVDLARHCGRELRRDRASREAAALTYHTLFSLFPTVVLAMVVLTAFVDEAERIQLRTTVVNWVLSPIQAREVAPLPRSAGGSALEGAGEDAAPADQNTTSVGADSPRQEFQEVRATLNDRVQQLIDSLEAVSFRRIGVVGILLFIYAATGLLSTIENSFNTIYKAPTGRSAFVRLPIYYTVITVGPIALVAGQVLQRRVLATLAGEGWNWVIGTLAVISPLVTAWLVLLLMYSLLPNTRVSLRMASAGSFVAAALWVLAIELFSIYVQRAAISTLYGALALLPLSLFWMWITWLIILFGLELTYALQSMREGRFRDEFQQPRDEVVIDRTLLLPLATRVAASFQRGELATLTDLSRDVFLPERAVERMMSALKRAGLVHQVADHDGDGFTLARPADDIRASEVLAASEALLPGTHIRAGERAWTLVDRLNRCLEERASDTTLAELSQAEQPA